jgi:hypothetical protein
VLGVGCYLSYLISYENDFSIPFFFFPLATPKKERKKKVLIAFSFGNIQKLMTK